MPRIGALRIWPASLGTLVVVVLLGCSSQHPLSPDASAAALPEFSAETAYCLAEINRWRATVGASALTRSERLEAFAAEAARVDTLAGVPHTHFRQTNGGNGTAAAENMIPWWLIRPHGSVRNVIREGLADMWARGPGDLHYEIMRGAYREAGCGIFVSDGEVTVSQDFR